MLPERDKFILVKSSKTFLNRVLWYILPVCPTCTTEAKKEKGEQNPTNDEIKTKTVYQRNKREKRNRWVTGRERDLALCFTIFFPFLLSSWS
jgi:hypothetical protein